MKVRALASLSGPMGRKTAGEEFVVNVAEGKELIDRKLVVPVDDAAPATETEPVKPVKAAKSKA